MKATLFIIENDRDQAKALIGKLMGSSDVADRARMTAQARFIEAYKRARWPRRTPTLPDLLPRYWTREQTGTALLHGAPTAFSKRSRIRSAP